MRRPNVNRAGPERGNPRVKEMRRSQPRHEPGSRAIRQANKDKMERRRGSSRASNRAIKPAARSKGRGKVNAAARTETARVAGGDLTRAAGRRTSGAAGPMAAMGMEDRSREVNLESGRNDWGRWKKCSISLICVARWLASVIVRVRCAQNSSVTAKSPNGISCGTRFFNL